MKGAQALCGLGVCGQACDCVHGGDRKSVCVCACTRVPVNVWTGKMRPVWRERIIQVTLRELNSCQFLGRPWWSSG